jgi:hypothetical protein
MNKLSVKERVNLYKQITDARKEFFKKLREHDMGQVAIQDIQMKALEPVTGKIEEVKKQAQEIYVELQEYFRLNRMNEEIVEMKKIYEEIKNVNEKLAFVKQVLEDIVNKQDVDFDEAKEDAVKDVRQQETKEEGTLQESKGEAPTKPGLKKVSSIGLANLEGKKNPELQQMLRDKWGSKVLKNLTKVNKEGLIELLLTDFSNADQVNNSIRQILQEQQANVTERRLPIAPASDIVIPSAATPVEEEGKVAVSGKGIKRKRGRPRKKQQTGKGMKKRGRPKKEDKHLVNSLVLHTGSKAAGNDNLDNDIKQIINRMHKNKMITATQKKELLEKYI